MLGLAASPLAGNCHLLQGRGRRLVIGPGEPGARPYHGLRVASEAQLEDIRQFVAGQGINMEPSPSAIFREDSVAVRDPDGWLTVFGLPRADLPSEKTVDAPGAAELPGRLQHVVVATNALGPMMAFYEDVLGYIPSDYVLRDEDDPSDRTVAFYRTDPEHRSFAVFEAAAVGADHHAFETTGWMDIRDWADHLAALDIKIWWGPGRHGPGNNLFFMFLDPHGDKIEISAELETFERETAPRYWPHDERTLNLWGPGWIRE